MISFAAVLGHLPGTTVYRNSHQYPEAYTYNGIVIVRVDASIYFANSVLNSFIMFVLYYTVLSYFLSLGSGNMRL